MASLVAIAAQIAGALAAALAVAELLSSESRGTQVVGDLWWIALCAAVLAAVCAATGAAVDCIRPNTKAPKGRSIRDVFSLLVLGAIAQILLSSDYKPFLGLLVFGSAAGVLAALRLSERRWPGWRNRGSARMLDYLSFQTCLGARAPRGCAPGHPP